MEWRNVIDYVGLYWVNKRGGVISAPRASTRGGLLKPKYDRQGYAYYSLCKDGTQKLKRAHVLVAEAFIGPRPAKHDVNHKDGNKRNPHFENLEYCTRRQNAVHSHRVLGNKGGGGLIRGEAVKIAKLTDKRVLEIRRLYTQGVSSPQLARQFGVERSTIWKVVTRRYWTHI